MSKLLEIIINHWNEPWEVGRDALQMLAIQKKIDWDNVSITMIHDGSEKFPQKYFKDFPFKIKQVCLPHCGISAARNYAIDHCHATWIKFCDFDDMFAGVYSVSCILDSLLNARNFDMLWFPLIIDMYTGQPQIYNCSPVFIHDKVIRVSFLKRENIRFCEDLWYSEDFAFMTFIKIKMDSSRLGKIESNFPIYIFCQRKGSVNNKPGAWFKNRFGHFDAHCYVENLLRENGQIYEANKMVARTMSECYCVLLSVGNDYDTSEYKRLMWDFFDQHKKYFDDLKYEDFDSIIDETNKQNNANITKDEFLQWIMKRGEQPHE